jgi:hypothetical protein
VSKSAKEGAAVVQGATDFYDAFRSTGALLAAGQSAYGDAAELVGSACGSIYVAPLKGRPSTLDPFIVQSCASVRVIGCPSPTTVADDSP